MSGRKRQLSGPPQPGPKRQQPNNGPTTRRSASPSKNARFTEDLIQGPSGTGEVRAEAGRSSLRGPSVKKPEEARKIINEIEEHRSEAHSYSNEEEGRSFLADQVNVIFQKLRKNKVIDATVYDGLKVQIQGLVNTDGPYKAMKTLSRRLSDAMAHDPKDVTPKPTGLTQDIDKMNLHSPITAPDIAEVQSKHNQTFQDNIEFFESPVPDKSGKDKDVIVCNEISKILEKVDKFAFSFSDEPKTRAFFDNLLIKENQQLIRYIGCLALGGPGGEQSWRELVTAGPTRHALVVGILGRALKEHVFADLWFGGTEEQKRQLIRQEKSEDFQHQDGFARTRDRADVIKSFRKEDNSLGFESHKVALQLATMLAPFSSEGSLSEADYATLFDIVSQAAALSRLMRAAPDVVYYWPPTFKDEEFEPARMECLNLWEMISSSPYEKKKVGDIERAVLREPGAQDKSEAIVKVVCFPGLVAYRQHGGELAAKELAAERKRGDNAPPDVRQARDRWGQAIDKNNGFRSKVVYKGLVYLQWGRQRLLTKEAGTSAHIDAVKNGTMNKYHEDYLGFRELYDIARERWGPEPSQAASPRRRQH